MTSETAAILLQQARAGFATLRESPETRAAVPRALDRLAAWLQDPALDAVSPPARAGIARAIRAGRWPDLLNAFHRDVRFGTAGIRTLLAFDKPSVLALREQGFLAPILRGPNTFNEVTLLLALSGAARYGLAHRPTPFSRVVIGCDSRVRGPDFAAAAAGLFLAEGYTVFLFDEPCPYPEIGFAATRPDIGADLGVFISASHNDYRYNGFKLTGPDGAQLDPDTRNAMYDGFIAKARFADIRRLPLDRAPAGRLIFLGDKEPRPGFAYGGRPRLPLHARFRAHVLTFLSAVPPPADARRKLVIGYCAFHGAGRRAVPQLLNEAGFPDIRLATRGGLHELDGLFPAFGSEPGREQQPDPGEPRAMDIALAACESDHPGLRDSLDILIGTDPDADRCGVMTRVPANQRHLYGGDFTLLSANDLWTLLLAFRLARLKTPDSLLPGADSLFLAVSHVTQESLAAVARRNGLGVVTTWVGFPALAAGVRAVWNLGRLAEPERGQALAALQALRNGYAPGRALAHPVLCECRDIHPGRRRNIVTCEQSNGFSILGDPPADDRSLGPGGHVPDKDGALAALLAAEAAAWAKARGQTLIDLLDELVWLDPEIGLYVGGYEPDPLEGEYPGVEGDRVKLAILARALEAAKGAEAGGLSLGGRAVTGSVLYRTGRYDTLYPPRGDFVFPDEGIRFLLAPDPRNHITVRPSGTGNSLRFYLQLHAPVTRDSLIPEKERLRREAVLILDDMRRRLGAPRR